MHNIYKVFQLLFLWPLFLGNNLFLTKCKFIFLVFFVFENISFSMVYSFHSPLALKVCECFYEFITTLTHLMPLAVILLCATNEHDLQS